MRTSVIVNALGGLLLGTAIVRYFEPRGGSWWGDSFFDIPYSIAAVAVPLVSAASGAIGSWVVLRKRGKERAFIIERGITIGVFAFVIYGLWHALTVALFVALKMGPLWGIAAGAAIGSAIAFFGGVFFLPLICIAMVLGEWLVTKIAL